MFDPTTSQCVPNCTNGTILSSSGCVIDPISCQDGTVLVGDQCVDQGRVHADLEEGAEPNGLGILGEASTVGAGMITMTGSAAFVIHGHIAPFQDVDQDGQPDPDIDTYTIHVDVPTALRISVDGVDGVMGGLFAVAQNVAASASLAAYKRIAINTTGDTAIRDLMLPSPGDYAFAIVDSRTLAFGGAFGSAGAEYYASITEIPLPGPLAIGLTGGSGTGSDVIANDQIRTYTVPAGLGFNEITMQGPHALTGAFDLLAGGAFLTNVEPLPDPLTGEPDPPLAVIAGFQATTDVTVVLDPVLDTTYAPAAIEIDVVEGAATALPTGGGTATEPETAHASAFGGAPIPSLNAFYYDVGSDADTVGMSLALSPAVEGVIVDANRNILTFFTDEQNIPGETFTTYTGLVRHPAPGRYYLLVDDPNSAASDVSVTSTVTALPAQVLATGSASIPVANGAADAELFTYAIDTAIDPWLAFAGAVSGGATLSIAAYDPSTALGRFGAVDTSDGAASNPPDTLPVLTRTGIGAAPGGGHIDIDDGLAGYLLDVRSSSSASYTFSVLDRAFTNLGTASATPTTQTGLMLAANGNFFLIRATAGDIVTFTVTPTNGAGAPPHLQISSLDADEDPLVTVSTGPASTAAITASFRASTSWVAVEVSGLSGADVGETFTLAEAITQEPTYGSGSAQSAVFTTICKADGSTDQAAVNNFDQPSTDSGLTAAIAIPPFTFYGTTVTALQVSTNGWLTFMPTPTDQGDSFNPNAPLPVTAPVALVAPYWDDLDQVEICETQTANRVTVEWKGFVFSPDAETVAVDFQAQLNTTPGAANGTIELVYGPGQEALGDSATVGIEDFAGSAATQIEANTPGSIAPSESFTLTP
jgi:hypothetical protein